MLQDVGVSWEYTDDTDRHPLALEQAELAEVITAYSDLQAGIPYKIEEGTADFHAVGRHTYITELLRNGLHLCCQLVRHCLG